MKLGEFQKTWEGMNWERSQQRMINGVLVLIVLFLVFLVTQKEEKIVLQPVTLGSEAWLMEEKSSQNYKEAWAFFMAQLQGNVDPSNVDFVKDRVEVLLTPRIRKRVMDSFTEQAQAIKVDGVRMRFEPEQVLHEESTGKLFVVGTGFVSGELDDEEKQRRTYEYKIAIQNFAPQFTSISTYQGEPKTQEVLEQLQLEAEREAERLKKRAGNS